MPHSKLSGEPGKKAQGYGDLISLVARKHGISGCQNKRILVGGAWRYIDMPLPIFFVEEVLLMI